MMTDRTLRADALATELRTLTGWTAADDTIRRTYETDGWRGSMLVANAIAFVCEAADHHADVTISWPRVVVTLSTHSAGGVTDKDIEVARLIEDRVMWKPPAGSTLSGPATPFVR